MKAECFGRRGAITLSAGQRCDNELTAIGINGFVIGEFVNAISRLPANDSDGKMMECQ
jgi:hypothetical protein